MLTSPIHWPFAALGTFLPSLILLIQQGHPAELESSWGSGISAVTRGKGGSPPTPGLVPRSGKKEGTRRPVGLPLVVGMGQEPLGGAETPLSNPV